MESTYLGLTRNLKVCTHKTIVECDKIKIKYIITNDVNGMKEVLGVHIRKHLS